MMIRNLSSKLIYQFARKTKPINKIKQALNLDQNENHDENLRPDLKEKHNVSQRMDPLDPDIDESFLSQLHLDIQNLPLPLQKRCQTVFQKYPANTVQQLGKDYMKLYQTLHANEKPIDLTDVTPFENSENLKKQDLSDDQIFLGSKQKIESIEEDGTQKKQNTLLLEDKKENTEEEKIPKNQQNNMMYETQLVYTQNMAIAYLLKKLPGTFAVACRVFTELKYRLPEFQPKSFLDFGAGLGSGSIAYQDLFGNGAIIACEPSTAMKKLGKYMTEDLEIKWVSTLSQTLNPSQFDLVYCGYVLEELGSANERKLILEALFAKTAPNGYMVIVEPGSPKGFRFIHDFRDWALKKNATLIAPCPHAKKCPLASQKSWCNFDQAVASYPKRIFPISKKSAYHEKFSYLIIKKGSLELNDSLQHKTFSWSRIVRPILKRNKHIIVDICNQDGDLERVISAKSYTEFDYKEVKKLKNGDLWRFPKRVPNKFRKESKTGKRLW